MELGFFPLLQYYCYMPKLGGFPKNIANSILLLGFLDKSSSDHVVGVSDTQETLPRTL